MEMRVMPDRQVSRMRVATYVLRRASTWELLESTEPSVNPQKRPLAWHICDRSRITASQVAPTYSQPWAHFGHISCRSQ